MRYWYDLEFLEDGRTIELISIGIVAADGREYYAVNDALTYSRWRPVAGRLARRVRKHQWLMANVVPSLPKPYGDWNLHMPKRWLFDYASVAVKPRAQIAAEVEEFLLAAGAPELWADYGAYDHVGLCQLWGSMIDLPSGLPMWTNDLRQELLRRDNPPVPDQRAGRHNALADALHLKAIHQDLEAR